MARKSKARAAAVELDPEAEATVNENVQKGDTATGQKKFGEALAAYDEALKVVPERHNLIAKLHGQKAAVYLLDRKFKEAVKECNQGLAVDGINAHLLYCRAQARMQMEMFKDALNDIQKVNASGEKSTETSEFESKVRSALAGDKAPQDEAAPPAAQVPGGTVTSRTTQQKYNKERTADILKQANTQFVCKVTLESETKYLHIPYGLSYHQLVQAIRDRWTGLVNFKIYYQDKDQDWVLITSAKDVNKAQAEILAYAQRVVNHRQRQGLDAQPPTCRFKLEKCRKADMPPFPREETPKGEEKSKVVVKSTDPHAEETVVELDDWLIDFANMFRDTLGIDPDKHVDMHTEGAERCTKALDTVVTLPEARGLFDEAEQRFRDVTCIGLCNWANVHLCLAKKLVEHAAQNGQTVADIRPEFDERCEKSIQRYNEALGYNAQYMDAMLGIGQVHIERARLQAGLLTPALDNVDSEHFKEVNQEELEEISKDQGKDANAKLRIALKSVTKEDVQRSAPIWAQVYEQFAAAEEAAAGSKSEKTETREASRADAVVSQPFQDETHLMKNQIKIIWGNALYDQSQIWAGVGLDGWKEMVEDAKARFLSATCRESDVMEALRNHIQAEELGLAPEEASESAQGAASAGTPKAQSEKKDAPKGLPGSGLKGKKKANK